MSAKEQMGIQRVDETISAKIANMSFVCVLLVVAIHIDWRVDPSPFAGFIKHYVVEWISRCAVPFFFMVSAFFLARHIGENGWWHRESVKRLRTLVLPFLIWNGTAVLLSFLQNATWDWSVWARKIGINPVFMPQLYPLWYVRALFGLVLLSPIIVYAIKKYAVGWLLLTALLYLLHESRYLHWLGITTVEFFYYGIPLQGLFYFSVGVVLGRLPRIGVSRRLAMTSFAIAFLGVAVGSFAASREINLGVNLVAITTPFIIMSLWVVMPSRRWGGVLVDNTFPVYVIHYFVIIGVGAVSGRYLSWGRALLEYLFVIVISIFAAEVQKRLWPRGYDVAFGGRGCSVRRHL